MWHDRQQFLHSSIAPSSVNPKARLKALVDYVQQCARMRTKFVATVAEHGRFVLSEQQALATEGVRLNQTGLNGDDELWLSVARPPNPQLPPTPDNPWLSPWLSAGGSLLDGLTLAPSVEGWALIAAGTHRDEALHAGGGDNRPAVAANERVPLDGYAFREHVERELAHYRERWQPWADAERQRRRQSRVYTQLFTLQQELSGATAEGQVELVWGLGLASSSGAPPDIATAYPLLTLAVDLTFDPHSAAAEVRPRDLVVRLELDYHTSTGHPGVAEAERQAKELLAHAASSVSPFDPPSYQLILALLKARLGSAAAPILPGDLTLGVGNAGLDVSDSWVLFARPRNTSALVQDLARLGDALRAWPDAEPLPPSIAALVTEPSTQIPQVTLPAFRGVSAVYQERAQTTTTPVDLYFPKPFNDEQVRIAQFLEAFDGVAVQGPPGTGKTHTIANILCHWLATGRRVLVTSMQDSALEVLRARLPEALRPLAVSLIAGEQQGAGQFARSTQKIAIELQSIDAATAERTVAQLEQTIDALHTRLARIDTEAGRWARLNLSRINLEGESVDPLDAALEVVAQTGTFEWLPDALGVGPQYAPRFDDSDIDRLRSARRELGADIEYANSKLPSLDALPTLSELLHAHLELVRFARLAADAQARDVPQLADTSADTLRAAQELAQDIARLLALRDEIAHGDRATAEALRDRLRLGLAADQLTLIEGVGHELEGLNAQWRPFLAKPVHLPERAEANAHFVAAVGQLARNKRPFGLGGLFGKALARSQLDAVTVNGHAPEAAEDWRHVASFIALLEQWRTLAAKWNSLAPGLGMTALAPVATLDAKPALQQLALQRRVAALDALEQRISAHTNKLFPHWPLAGKVASHASALMELRRALTHHLSSYRVEAVLRVRDKLQAALDGANGRMVDDLRKFATDVLGNPAYDETALTSAWSTCLAELTRVHGLAALLAAVAKTTQQIAQSGAPQFAQRLLRPSSDDETLLPHDWRRVWRLRRLATHLTMIDSQEEFKKLARQRSELEHDLARAYQEIVVQRSWLSLARNATPAVRAALQAYLNAMQRIAQSSGKRTLRHRQDAREAALLANAAVPCWIMPHHRVSESLPAELGCFDLVIIDEASQSDLSALPALLRARKFLIVGDDRQVSPEGFGLDEHQIKTLTSRFLGEQPPLYRAQMSPERSIYDLAKVVFAHSGVMLKEHFRCVAPIIEYSKREFYDHELRPLRVPRASERLDPALVDVYLPEGRQSGGVNIAEVDFIVAEIRRLIADAQMEQRSIGVVSLLGEEQALKIWDRLNEELGPEILQRRHIACGDARAFQGRERDLMFLSLVAAPDEPVAALARDVFAQRFNVATSRARDRMYLVRSIMPEQLAAEDGLRRGIILHFGRTEELPPSAANLRERCESPFERDLYDWLVREGYRVKPQVNIGTYRIDLVVEGLRDSRLAVECDGDRHHSPEKWTEDMRRQRVLERTGWTFWRCFASTFVRRREAVLEDLRGTLSALGIEPLDLSRAEESDRAERH